MVRRSIESSLEKLSEVGMGIVGMHILWQLVAPGNQTVEIINAMSQGFASTVRAATGSTVLPDPRTPADRFKEDAYDAIASFWEGFREV